LRERRRLDAGRHAAEQFNGAVEFGGPPLAVVLGLGEQPNAALGLGYAEALEGSDHAGGGDRPAAGQRQLLHDLS
jgi:hypothetical protein